MKGLPSTEMFIDASHLDLAPLVQMWPKSIAGTVTPIGSSAFGHLFFQRPEGNVQSLDVLEGGVHHAASHLDEFKLLMNSKHWRDANLMSHGLRLAKSRGLARAKGQFFGFAQHPWHCGQIDWSLLTCLEAMEWHSICAKALDGPTGQATRKPRPTARGQPTSALLTRKSDGPFANGC